MILQIVEWGIVVVGGTLGFRLALEHFELFKKRTLIISLLLSVGWIIFQCAFSYSAMWPEQPCKGKIILNFLIFNDGFGREDITQIMAYLFIIWSILGLIIYKRRLNR